MAPPMKYPTICEAPGARSGWRVGPVPAATDVGKRPVYASIYGRLRPRFVDAGAWHELWCVLKDDPARHGDDEDLDRVIAKLFERGADGSMPDGMALARELVWPIEDVLGVPQCIVVPGSDQQILELVEALCAGPARCRPSAHVVVRGAFAGLAESLPGKLRGLPQVTLASALPYDFASAIGSGADEDRERLFRSYRSILANNGLGDELRAVNYLLTQSAPFYELASRLEKRTCEHHHEQRLVAMHAMQVEGTERAPQMEVICTFQGVEGGVRRWFQRVDVQGPFMFFTTDEMQPFYVRPSGAVRPQSFGTAVGSRGFEGTLVRSQEPEPVRAEPARAEPVSGEAAAVAEPNEPAAAASE